MTGPNVHILRARLAALDAARNALRLSRPVAWWAFNSAAGAACVDGATADTPERRADVALQEAIAAAREQLRALAGGAAVPAVERAAQLRALHASAAADICATYRGAAETPAERAYWRAVALAIASAEQGATGRYDA